ncbi:MAG: hypothetical protein ACRDZ7_07795 [Acidimicrobiia bacterium]
MDEAFDKNQALADGYQQWVDTGIDEWRENPDNLVCTLLAPDVTVTNHEGRVVASNKEQALLVLEALKREIILDPLSVRVGTTRDHDVSFGSDWETTAENPYSSWHHCIDRFEWVAVPGERDPKIGAIHVCFADDRDHH